MSNYNLIDEHNNLESLFQIQKLSIISGHLPTSTIIYCVLILFLLIKYKRQQNEKKSSELVKQLKELNLKRMPTPPQLPLIGHIHLMRDYQHNPWEGFNAICKQYGELVSLKMGVHQMVLISSVDYMNEVLIKKGHIFADRPTFPRHDIVFGGDKEHSLALCNWSNTHRARRKFCKRGVVPNKLSARNQLLERVISEITNNFTLSIMNDDVRKRQISSKLDDIDGGRIYYIVDKRDLLFLTGDIFMKFLCNETRQHKDKAYEDFNIGCDFIFYDINQCYLLDFMPYLTSIGLGYSYLKQLRDITDYCRYYIDDNIFEPRRAHHLEQAKKQDEPIDFELLKKDDPCRDQFDQITDHDSSEDTQDDDYLDSIIRDFIAGASSMTLEDYKVGFADLLAGHAAVTNILMRLLGHLALDPVTQEMIYEEATKVNLTDLTHAPPLPVAEAALQEALRLASSPIVPHVAREDTSIGEYFVPKGSAVLFNCYNINLSPHIWHEPRKFQPTRFLQVSENKLGEKSYKLNLPKYFMPFSVGQRQCLGYKMVESISVVTVACLCSKYIIKANDEQLVERLLESKGTVALNPLQECFSLHLFPREKFRNDPKK